jgi:hypothetical protein
MKWPRQLAVLSVEAKANKRVGHFTGPARGPGTDEHNFSNLYCLYYEMVGVVSLFAATLPETASPPDGGVRAIQS